MRSTVLIGLAGLVVGAFVGATLLPPLIGADGGPGFVAGGSAEELFTIGTGGVTGVYYPTGGAICLLVNKDRKIHGIRCSVESTGGSVANINSIRIGKLDLGIVQSDWQYHSFAGTSRFKGQKPFKDLRSVFSLHSEPFTVVARADAGIRTFQDLKGKRVNIGNPGSGQRATMEVVMKAFGWTKADFYATTELESRDQSAALCDGVIDAMVFTVGHPSQSIKEATSSCDSLVIDVTGPAIDRLVGENDYYRHAFIPAGMYRGNLSKAKTFGVSATLVTVASLPEELVYTAVKAVFSNFEAFKALHPAFKYLKKSEMIKNGLSAPLHPGAVKYYREAGLM
ncbi:MAG: TAXI family TRAP transporter solute-binding subunit [Rhodospirillales bacterium]